ncbi:unnamed protein product [Rhizophagus irregularis]|uniref:Uncharacterized protein n=1 Tax=Rhizophagus irregularis TaxID=588596 RepID=A0A915Z1Q1_9GLOM|nr:unnamed protein product [Rhizophagus irregularis]
MIKKTKESSKLLSPSNATRSKSIPRPQNPWVLYRKNISKGLIGLNMSTGEFPEIHSIEYPNYKYSPVKSHNQNKSSKEVISQNTNLDTSVLKDSSEIVSHTTSEIDIDMSEVDIDMINP